MGYALGMDLGTTYTAAAVARHGRAEVAALGYRATSVPTVVLLTEDGRFLVGDAAERRAGHEPQRVAREFKRRVGDPTPIMLGGTPIAVDRCLAEVLRWVIATIGEAEGGPPAAVTVTHPANWGEFKRDVLREALRMVDVDSYRLLPEPVAAATWYAQTERLAPGRTVAVFDLGGGTFDATVLRRRADGQFESLGRTEGIDRLGGIDVDEAVFRYVLRSVGEDAADLAHADEDPRLMAATTQLRRASVEAKEALSSETSVTIPVWLPGVHHEVLLQRTELEELVGPLLRPTVDALARVVTSAGLRPDDLDAVLLVGGSSRIPLISRQVSAAFGRPIAVDAHPKHPVALGAALDADAHRPAEPAGPGAAGIGIGATATALATAPLLAPGGLAGPGGPAGPGTPGGPAGMPTAVAGAVDAPPGPAGAAGTGAPPGWAGSTPSGPHGVPSGLGPAPGYGFPAQAGATATGAAASIPALAPVATVTGSVDDGARRLVAAILAVGVVVAIIVVLLVVRGAGGDGGDDPDTAIADPGTGVGDPAETPGEGEGVTPATAEGGGTTVAPTTAATVPPGSNLLTGDPSPALDAFAGIHDPVRVREVLLYPDYAFAEVQVADQPTALDEYRWDGGLSGPEVVSLLDMERDELGEELFDLSEIDPAVIPGAVAQTLQECGPNLTVSHVIIDRELDFDPQKRVLVRVYADNERGEGGYFRFALDGAFVENMCD